MACIRGKPLLNDDDAEWLTRAMIGLRTEMNGHKEKKWGTGELAVDMGRPTMRGTPPWRPNIDARQFIDFKAAAPEEEQDYIPTHGQRIMLRCPTCLIGARDTTKTRLRNSLTWIALK